MKDGQRFLAAEDGRYCFGMTDGRGESDSLEVVFCIATQPLESDGQLDSTAIMRELVDLVDDDVSDRREMTLHDFPWKDCLKGLRSRDEDVGRNGGLLPTLGRRGVSMSHCYGEFCRLDQTLDAIDHVSVQRAQRRHVEDLDATLVSRSKRF